MPMAPLSIESQDTQQVRLVCNQYGRCFRTGPRYYRSYYAPRRYYGGYGYRSYGPRYGYGGGYGYGAGYGYGGGDYGGDY